MFTQAWKKAVGEQVDDGNKVMLHLLSWPSFARCLEMFSTGQF
jgi:hypothetical protein